MVKQISKLIFVFILAVPLMFQNTADVEVQGASLRSVATFDASADTYIYGGKPDVNYGDSHSLRISDLDIDREITLIKFDISALPSDAVIIDATMWLCLSWTTQYGDSSVGVYFLTSAWNESSITWNTASGLTTSPIGITIVVDDDLSNTWKSFGLLGDYVQTWHDDPSSNHGLMIRPMPTGGFFGREFYSREDAYYAPYLEVSYYQESTYQELSGRVYQGDVGIEFSSSPMEDVRLDLYCSTSPDILGTLIDTTRTDSEGWYGLKGYDGCDYYNIVEVDPSGYISDGATTVDGAVINANQIQYEGNLSAQWRLGNKFWDKPGYNIFLPMIME